MLRQGAVEKQEMLVTAWRVLKKGEGEPARLGAPGDPRGRTRTSGVAEKSPLTS